MKAECVKQWTTFRAQLSVLAKKKGGGQEGEYMNTSDHIRLQLVTVRWKISLHDSFMFPTDRKKCRPGSDKTKLAAPVTPTHLLT